MNKQRISKILIFTALFLFGLLISYYYKSRLKNEGVYVIGGILGFDRGGKGSYIIKFSFEFRGKKYISGESVNKKNKELIGRRYIIKIVPEDPKINKILFDKRIQCDTLTAPYNGWKEIPSHFPFYQDEDGNLYIQMPCIAYDSNYLEKMNEKIDKIINESNFPR